jgi:hypothetical protein
LGGTLKFGLWRCQGREKWAWRRLKAEGYGCGLMLRDAAFSGSSA